MRVLIIPERFPENENDVGGIFIHDQIKAISNFAEVEVFYTKPYGNVGLSSENANRALIHRHSTYTRSHLKMLKPLQYYRWIRSAEKLARNLKPFDIIHLHGSTLRGDMAVKLSRFFKCPLLVTEHTGPWSTISSRKLIWEMAKKTMQAADMVLPVSTHLKDEIIKSGIRPKSVEVLGNPVDTDFFNLHSKKENPKQMLFASRMDEFKGAYRTVKAFENVAAKIPEWNLVLAGNGEEEMKLMKYVKDQELSKRVTFLPFQNREGLRNLFRESSFLVFPSRHESFGLVAAEAMACGLPVVCTNRTGPLDFFNEKAGIAVDPDSIDQISNALLNMVEFYDRYNPQLIRSLIVEKYSPESYGNNLKRIYERLQN